MILWGTVVDNPNLSIDIKFVGNENAREYYCSKGDFLFELSGEATSGKQILPFLICSLPYSSLNYDWLHFIGDHVALNRFIYIPPAMHFKQMFPRGINVTESESA